MAKIELNFHPITIFKGLLGIITVLLILNMLSTYVYLTTENFRSYHNFFIRLFDFSHEGNVPAYFSSLLLLFASSLLFLISFTEKLSQRKHLGWMGLGFVFAFLAIDEAVAIHEYFTEVFRNSLNLSGYLYYAWVIPYGIGVLALAFAYIPFFLKLDLRMFKLMMLSGVVFITGAIGLELIGGKWFVEGSPKLTLMILYTVEELLEMVGVSIFIYSLLWYISIRDRKLSVEVIPNPSDIEGSNQNRTVQDTFFR